VGPVAYRQHGAADKGRAAPLRQVREAMLARDIPYVKITASRYAKGC
jgi:tRNA isopentenyl-2-thiomethyl-A-37 hydroxylase MiaE